MQFAVGDIVQLKSGGPEMTVSYVGDDGYGEQVVGTTWFNNSKPENAQFKPAMLEKVQ